MTDVVASVAPSPNCFSHSSLSDRSTFKREKQTDGEETEKRRREEGEKDALPDAGELLELGTVENELQRPMYHLLPT